MITLRYLVYVIAILILSAVTWVFIDFCQPKKTREVEKSSSGDNLKYTTAVEAALEAYSNPSPDTFRVDPSGNSPGFKSVDQSFFDVPNLNEFKSRLNRQIHLRAKENTRINSRQLLTRLPTPDSTLEDNSKILVEIGEAINAIELCEQTGLQEQRDEICQTVMLWANLPDDQLGKLLDLRSRALLRSLVFYAVGRVNNDEALLQKSIVNADKFTSLVNRNQQEAISHIAPGRRIQIARMGINSQEYRNEAIAILEEFANRNQLNPIAAKFLIDEYLSQGRVSGAVSVIRNAGLNKQNKFGLKHSRVVQIETIGDLTDFEGFSDHFGPFAKAIWHDVSHLIPSGKVDETLDGNPLNNDFAGMPCAVRVDRVIVYESQDDQVDGQMLILPHEMIHSFVANRISFKVENRFETVKFDVPYAAMLTYIQFLQQCQEKKKRLPPILDRLIEKGRVAFANEDYEKYITTMDTYFRAHGTETPATYDCAAILLGLVSEDFKSKGLEVDHELLTKYTFHRLTTDHPTAMRRLEKGIDVEFKGQMKIGF